MVLLVKTPLQTVLTLVFKNILFPPYTKSVISQYSFLVSFFLSIVLSVVSKHNCLCGFLSFQRLSTLLFKYFLFCLPSYTDSIVFQHGFRFVIFLLPLFLITVFPVYFIFPLIMYLMFINFYFFLNFVLPQYFHWINIYILFL